MSLPIPLSAVVAVARRPTLWSTAISSMFSLAPERWWQGPSRLPMPSEDWFRFRTETAYGGSGEQPIKAEDLITWLRWRKEFPS